MIPRGLEEISTTRWPLTLVEMPLLLEISRGMRIKATGESIVLRNRMILGIVRSPVERPRPFPGNEVRWRLLHNVSYS
jgi:hypothetical protein